jgi:hypothetical protein
MTQLGRRFGLSDVSGNGVSCGENGAFVGEVPLLEQPRGTRGLEQWRPRPVSDLNRDLGKRYGLPVECDAKIGGLTAIARALDRGDLFHARIATLHLQIPDPPPQTKSAKTRSEIVDLARQLQASGLLKAGWDPTKHPRWPAGSPQGVGGEFAPSGSSVDDSTLGEPSAPVIPAQVTIPAPFDFPIPGAIPFPSEIVPPPLMPNINPRGVPRNPYPDRPECEEEWAHAFEYCNTLMRRGRLGKGDYRGMGKTFYQCLMGQVSEDCGGNITSQNL